MFLDGLEDAETGRLMGAFAQEMADKKGYTREEMDEYAITSLTRAKKAIEDGLLKDEIIPVTVKSRKGEVVVEDDEQPHNANIEKIPSLRPAFAKDGTVTAANASSISDGASALLLMRESEAEKRGLKPLARIVGHSTQSQHPSEFTCAPVGAIETLFGKTGWSKDDVDLFEINEAFAMVAMMPIRELGLDPRKSTFTAAPARRVTPSAPPALACLSPSCTLFSVTAKRRALQLFASVAARLRPWRLRCFKQESWIALLLRLLGKGRSSF